MKVPTFYSCFACIICCSTFAELDFCIWLDSSIYKEIARDCENRAIPEGEWLQENKSVWLHASFSEAVIIPSDICGPRIKNKTFFNALTSSGHVSPSVGPGWAPGTNTVTYCSQGVHRIE